MCYHATLYINIRSVTCKPRGKLTAARIVSIASLITVSGVSLGYMTMTAFCEETASAERANKTRIGRYITIRMLNAPIEEIPASRCLPFSVRSNGEILPSLTTGMMTSYHRPEASFLKRLGRRRQISLPSAFGCTQNFHTLPDAFQPF